MKQLAKRLLPAPVRDWLRSRLADFRQSAQTRSLTLGSLRTVNPISRVFGYDRKGQRVGRYYIDQFLGLNAIDIRGRVLEIGDATYTRQFGGNNVTCSDVLHAVEGNPCATIVGDLTTGRNIPSDTFDCIVLTQTLPAIYDLHSTIRTLYRILKPGGVLLMTTSGLSQTSRYDMDRWGDFWRLTSLSARRLTEEAFPPENVTVVSYGNVLAAIMVLHGLTIEEFTKEEIDYRDADYEVIIAIRAVKPAERREV